MLGKVLRDIFLAPRGGVSVEPSRSILDEGPSISEDGVSGNARVRTASFPERFPWQQHEPPLDRRHRNLLSLGYDESRLSQLNFNFPAQPIRCFWSGPKPNAIALLALRSFVHHGHAVWLYTYDAVEELAAEVPSGVAVRAAGDVVPRAIYEECLAQSEVRYFSDIFRYAVLYRFGGWWVDTDVVLVRPLPAVESHFFSSQWNGGEFGHMLVGDVLHLPKGSAHSLLLYRASLANLREASGDRSFGAVGPKLLTQYVLSKPGLMKHVFSPTLFNSIDWTEVELFLTATPEVLELACDPRVIGLHLWNKMWVERNLTLDMAPSGSVGRLLLDHYAVPDRLTQLASRHRTDKGSMYKNALSHHYSRIYQGLFETRLFQKIRIMEIGLCRGLYEGWEQDDVPSLRMWLDFFPNATVLGVDVSDFSWFVHERVRIFRADQSSAHNLRENVVEQLGTDTLDIIIDDGSHASWDQQITFGELFPLLAPGGIYIFEDLDWQPPLNGGGVKVPPTKQVLEHFVATGQLRSPAWTDSESEWFAATIDSVEFHDSYRELIDRGQCGGLGVLRKKA